MSVTSNRTAMHMKWEQPQNTCGLKIFLAEVGDDGNKQQVIRHPHIIEIIEGSATITSSLTKKISKNM